MKVVPVLAAALVIYIAIPGSNQGKGKKPKPKFCTGADGNRYKKGEGYEDKEVCVRYTCTKSRNKFKMKMEEIQCVESESDLTASVQFLNASMTSIETKFEALQTSVESILEMMTTLQSSSNKLETCLGDAKSPDCPSSEDGKISVSDAIKGSKEDIEALKPKFNLVVTAGYGTWTNRVGTSSVISPGGVCGQCIPPLPVRILAPQSVYFNNYLMVCGGNSINGDPLKSCVKLRDSNSQWTDGPAMNIKRQTFSMTKAGQDLYALGGVGGANGREILDSMEKMSGCSGEWILMDQNLTSTRQSHCTVFMESTMSLVIIGGWPQTWKSGASSLVEEFSLATTSWKELAPLPIALASHGCAVMDDDTIVVTGGYNGNAGGKQNKVYQLVGGKWHTSGSLEVARNSHTMGILDNRLLILGGFDLGGNDLDSMEELQDDGNFRIMQWKLPAKRGDSAITQIPREIFPC